MTLRQYSFQAIGTRWAVQTSSELAETEWSKLQAAIQARIEAFDKGYSRFREDSWVTTIGKQAGEYDLPPDGYKMLAWYERLYEATGGLVTPLIGQVLVDTGYDAQYSFQSKPAARPDPWKNVIEYSADTLHLKKPVLLDFGAAGKGYLVDIVSDLIRNAGINDYTIDAGGDILHRSADDQEIVIGLENPVDTTEVIGEVRLCNQSLCASAGSRRKWGDYHHIIDPSTLQSPTNIIATWVIATDTITADGLATALFFVSPQQLHDRFKCSYAVLHDDMTIEYASDFPVTLYKAE